MSGPNNSAGSASNATPSREVERKLGNHMTDGDAMAPKPTADGKRFRTQRLTPGGSLGALGLVSGEATYRDDDEGASSGRIKKQEGKPAKKARKAAAPAAVAGPANAKPATPNQNTMFDSVPYSGLHASQTVDGNALGPAVLMPVTIPVFAAVSERVIGACWESRGRLNQADRALTATQQAYIAAKSFLGDIGVPIEEPQDTPQVLNTVQVMMLASGMPDGFYGVIRHMNQQEQMDLFSMVTAPMKYLQDNDNTAFAFYMSAVVSDEQCVGFPIAQERLNAQDKEKAMKCMAYCATAFQELRQQRMKDLGTTEYVDTLLGNFGSKDFMSPFPWVGQTFGHEETDVERKESLRTILAMCKVLGLQRDTVLVVKKGENIVKTKAEDVCSGSELAEWLEALDSSLEDAFDLVWSDFLDQPRDKYSNKVDALKDWIAKTIPENLQPSVMQIKLSLAAGFYAEGLDWHCTTQQMNDDENFSCAVANFVREALVKGRRVHVDGPKMSAMSDIFSNIEKQMLEKAPNIQDLWALLSNAISKGLSFEVRSDERLLREDVDADDKKALVTTMLTDEGTIVSVPIDVYNKTQETAQLLNFRQPNFCIFVSNPRGVREDLAKWVNPRNLKQDRFLVSLTAEEAERDFLTATVLLTLGSSVFRQLSAAFPYGKTLSDRTAYSMALLRTFVPSSPRFGMMIEALFEVDNFPSASLTLVYDPPKDCNVSEQDAQDALETVQDRMALREDLHKAFLQIIGLGGMPCDKDSYVGACLVMAANMQRVLRQGDEKEGLDCEKVLEKYYAIDKAIRYLIAVGPSGAANSVFMKKHLEAAAAEAAETLMSTDDSGPLRKKLKTAYVQKVAEACEKHGGAK